GFWQRFTPPAIVSPCRRGRNPPAPHRYPSRDYKGHIRASVMGTEPEAPVYFILHLPKTAGSTIEVHLEEYCPSGTLWRPKPAPRRQRLIGQRYDLRDLPDMRRVRVVVGHYVGRSLEKYFPSREIRRIVLLRDPLGLQISYYNYMNMWYLDEGLGT